MWTIPMSSCCVPLRTSEQVHMQRRPLLRPRVLRRQPLPPVPRGTAGRYVLRTTAIETASRPPGHPARPSKALSSRRWHRGEEGGDTLRVVRPPLAERGGAWRRRASRRGGVALARPSWGKSGRRRSAPARRDVRVRPSSSAGTPRVLVPRRWISKEKGGPKRPPWPFSGCASARWDLLLPSSRQQPPTNKISVGRWVSKRPEIHTNSYNVKMSPGSRTRAARMASSDCDLEDDRH